MAPNQDPQVSPKDQLTEAQLGEKVRKVKRSLGTGDLALSTTMRVCGD